MIGTVIEVCLDSNYRIAGKRTCLYAFLKTLFNCRENGNAPDGEKCMNS